MAGGAKRNAGWAGAGAIVYSVASTILDLFGIPGDLERWKVIVGPITMEGLRQLALLVGLMLIAPILGESIEIRRNRWLARRRENRAAHRYAKRVMPHLSKDELITVRRLLDNPGMIPLGFPEELVELVRAGHPSIYALKPNLRRTIKRYLRVDEQKEKRQKIQAMKEYLETADKAARTVLWAFARPRISEPATVLSRSPFDGAIIALHRTGVLEVKWHFQRARKISLSPEALPLVEHMVLKRPAERTELTVFED